MGISVDCNGVAAVNTSRETIATRNVVNAAGPWARSVAKMVNIDLPVDPLRRMLVPTEPFDEYPHSAPMTVDMSTGFHFRPEALGIPAGMERSDGDAGIQDGFRAGVHREDPGTRRRPRTLLRSCADQSQARVGRAIRDDAGPSSDPGTFGRCAWLLLRQWLQWTRRDARASHGKDTFGFSVAWGNRFDRCVVAESSAVRRGTGDT